jgi:molybdopterin synthase sulfur carrier subunit
LPHVFIPTQLRELTGGQDRLTLSGTSVRALVRELDARFPGIAKRLIEDDHLATGLVVSIDGRVTPRGLLASVAPNSEVHFLPAVGGG